MDSLSEGEATLGSPICKFLHLVQKIANRECAVKLFFSCCDANAPLPAMLFHRAMRGGDRPRTRSAVRKYVCTINVMDSA
jgi:hypothetical protein